MTKREVLEIFVRRIGWVRPDDIWRSFNKNIARVSVYTFLLRIYRQKLLERNSVHGRIAYSLSRKGRERLEFFRKRDEQHESQRHDREYPARR